MARKSRLSEEKKVGLILYLCYCVLLGLSVFLLGKIIYLQVAFNPEPKIYGPLTPKNTKIVIEPVRGQIFDCNGKLLAISFPVYSIRLDCTVGKDEEWIAKARLLASELPHYFPEKTAEQYFRLLKDERARGQRYLKLGKPVDYTTMEEIKKLPLFNEGRNKGGLIIEQKNVRRYPYGKLARRTIGFVRDNRPGVTNNKVGLEGKFNSELHGKDGLEWKRITDKGKSIHNFDSTFVAAEDGCDIHTTINIDIQEAADRILRSKIEPEEDLESATLAVMDVRTGALRAIVNLSREDGNGPFGEITNTLIGRKHEPGSVFKTVTLLAALAEGAIDSLGYEFPTNHGFVRGTSLKQDTHITDYERTSKSSKITVLHGFETSSNYVFATLALKAFGSDPNKYLEYLHKFMLDRAFDFELAGLQTPTTAAKKDRKDWNLTDLGSMGFGYTTEETPLHILTFYNAIANDGRMMKPYLVENIGGKGSRSDEYGPKVLAESICTKAVADTVTRALVAVTRSGTAKWSFINLKKFDVAGKTGTSFGTYPKSQAGADMYHDVNGRRKYQGTFVGFFPADNPQYTAICAVYSKPTSKSYQGGGIPARTIKDLAEYISNIDPAFRETLTR